MPTLAGSGPPLLPWILFQVEARRLSRAQPAHPFPAPGVLPGTPPSVTASSPHLLSAPLPTPTRADHPRVFTLDLSACVHSCKMFIVAKCLLLRCVDALLIYVNEAAL